MSSTSQTGGIASGGGTTYAPYTPTETYEFKLDKRGRVTLYWSTKSFQLCGLQLSCGSSDSGSFPSKMTLKSVAKTVDKGGEMYGLIVEGAPNKRWLLRAKDKESFAYAHHFLFNALCHHNAHEVENFGLPPIDPRVNLPFIDVPAMHVERFGLLGKAVLYVFDDVVEIAEVIEEEEEEEEEDTEENHGNGSDAQGKIEKKSVENDTNKKGCASSVPEPILAEVSRVLILGDRCIYICTESSDIERCIRVLDIEMLFVTQNDEELGIRMIREPDGSILEPDLLLKCFDCKSFVPKLTAVYNFLRRDKEPLKIERGLDEDELLNNVLSLHIPDTWTLKLTLPTSRKNLAKTLEVMEENQRMIHNKSAIAAQNSTNACGTNLAPAPSVGMVMLPSLTVLPGANAEDICGEHANISDQEEENAGKSEAAVEAPLSDPLAMFLTKLNLCDAYYTKLRYQHVDWEVFRVFEYDDMACFGIYNEEHRTTLLKHSLDEDFVRIVEEESRAHQLRKRGALDPSLSKATSATGVLRKKTTATSNKSNRARAVLFTGDDDESNTVGKMSSTSDKNPVTVSNVDMEDLDDDLEVDLGLGNRKKSAGLLPSLSFLDDLDDLGNGSPLRATLMKKKSFALDGDLFGSPRKKQSIRFSGLKKGSENASGPSASVDIDLDDILASPRLKKKVSMAQFHINKQKIIDLDNDDLLASPRAKGAGSVLVNLDDL